MPLPPGTSVGRYRILSAIGAGGMGEVYLAEDERLRRRVALKVLPTELAPDAAAGKRLLREARAAATLDHPNICTVYEVGEAGGRGFIAMQYLEGHTLADRVKVAPLDLLAAISIGRQVADAVAEAHRHGIVHRDIKPQNIIVSGDNRATVLDFGLAKAIAPVDAASATATMLTEPGPSPVVIVPLKPGQVFPEFPADGEQALAAWRKLPGARVEDRPESIPGLDPLTYVLTKTDERRNLFRVPLPR